MIGSRIVLTRGLPFAVALSSAVLASAIYSGSVDANGTWRFSASSCDNSSNTDLLIDQNGMVLNEDDSTDASAWCDIPIFADGTTGTGTERTCDIDLLTIEVNDGNGDVGTLNGVRVTLITHQGTFDAFDSCSTINTEDISSGFTGNPVLQYDETDGGADEGDIDSCTNNSNNEWLVINAIIPDDEGAGPPVSG